MPFFIVTTTRGVSNSESPSDPVKKEEELPMKVDPSKSKDHKVEETHFALRFKQFVSEVSVVGLKYALDCDSYWPRRVTWLSLVLAGLVLMAFQIHDRVTYFFTYPTIVDVRVTFNSSIPFPIATICSENMVKKSPAVKEGKYNLSHSICAFIQDGRGRTMMVRKRTKL